VTSCDKFANVGILDDHFIFILLSLYFYLLSSGDVEMWEY